MSQVRTYMSYSFPVDPGRIFSIADMDLSYALASTLVEWDSKKQVGSALATSWTFKDDRTLQFKIKPQAKWSNGSVLTSAQVKASFDRAFRVYPTDLRAVISLVKEIRTPDPDTIEFELVSSVRESNILGKLTEPQYGILFVDRDGEFNPSITTGAFYAEVAKPEEIVLKRNPNWIGFQEEILNEVVIRKPPSGFDHEKGLLEDSWPNLSLTFSLLSKELVQKYKDAGYSIWTRPFDKVNLISASKSLAAKDLLGLVQFLDQNLSRERVTFGVTGISVAQQVFPVGYHLYDSAYRASTSKAALPKEFGKRPVQILYPGNPRESKRFENLKAALTDALGIEPEFQFVPLDQTGARRIKGDYDIYLGGMGLADPDPEGFMSYYFEGDAPVVPPGKDRFVERLDRVRKIKDSEARLAEMRKLLGEAKDKGYILPLYHFGTLGLARNELDLSSVPETDESITLSKIRLRK